MRKQNIGMAKEAYYFSHDSNTKDDPKCSLLIEELGLEGYGIYWVLIETLRDQPLYRYPIKMIPILARKYNTTSAKVEVIVRNYGLFEVSNDEFFSISLLKRMEQKEAKSLKAKESVNQRWLRTKYENDTNVLQSNYEGNTIKESKVKEIKEKESKENKIEDRKIAFGYSLKEFESSYSKEMLTAFFRYWTEKNKSGTKMKWELEKTFEVSLRLINWASRDKTFQTAQQTTPSKREFRK
jgi:hypothetical protein